MNYLNVKQAPKLYQPSSEHMRLQVESLRNAIRLNRHKDKMAKYRNLHEIDVTDSQEPDDYDKTLMADKGYAEFIKTVDSTPF